MSPRCLLTALLLACSASGFAHEFPGRAAHEQGAPTSIGSELYVGKRGYIHAGEGVSAPLGKHFSVEIGAHVVREQTGAAEVPSFEAELIRDFENGWELEAFGFGYAEVGRKQHGALASSPRNGSRCKMGLWSRRFAGRLMRRCAPMTRPPGRLRRCSTRSLLEE